MAVKIWPRVAETAKITLFRYQRPNGGELVGLYDVAPLELAGPQ